MNERLVVKCKGLFLKSSSGRYHEIKSLEFLLKGHTQGDEQKVMNPVIIEDCIAKSFPGDATNVFEETLPRSLFALRTSVQDLDQENNLVFIYKGKEYIFVNNLLYMLLQKEA